jgi:predicted ATPase
MQTQSVVDQIRQRLSGIADNYNRLVLLVGPPGSGRTAVLRALADAEKVPVLNVGAEISRRLLDLTERQRVLQLPKLLEEAVAGLPGNLTILDNTEVLSIPCSSKILCACCRGCPEIEASLPVGWAMWMVGI